MAHNIVEKIQELCVNQKAKNAELRIEHKQSDT